MRRIRGFDSILAKFLRLASFGCADFGCDSQLGLGSIAKLPAIVCWAGGIMIAPESCIDTCAAGSDGKRDIRATSAPNSNGSPRDRS